VALGGSLPTGRQVFPPKVSPKLSERIGNGLPNVRIWQLFVALTLIFKSHRLVMFPITVFRQIPRCISFIPAGFQAY
jgi:hypothetical protein